MSEPVVPQEISDAEIHAIVAATVFDVLLPALPADAEWARAAAVQLVGLTRYAAVREPDRTIDDVAELAATLDRLNANPIVAEVWDRQPTQVSVSAAAGAALAIAVGRGDAPADEIRRVLRPRVVAQLDAELARTASLVDAFRGRLDG